MAHSFDRDTEKFSNFVVLQCKAYIKFWKIMYIFCAHYWEIYRLNKY
jgi:hypothetical protein